MHDKNTLSKDELARDKDNFSHSSEIIPLFAKSFQGRHDSCILDMGPASKANMSFFSPRTAKIYLRDMYRRLDFNRGQELSFSEFIAYLDFPSKSFDGILLWDICDRLDDNELDILVKHCYDLIKPQGVLMVLAHGIENKKESTSKINSYHIEEDYKVYTHPHPYQNLKTQQRDNNTLQSIFGKNLFFPVKSMLYRNNIREILFKRKTEINSKTIIERINKSH